MSYDISPSLSYFTQHNNQSRDFVAMLSPGDQTSSIYPSRSVIRTHIANTGVKEKNDPSNICMAFVTNPLFSFFFLKKEKKERKKGLT